MRAEKAPKDKKAMEKALAKNRKEGLEKGILVNTIAQCTDLTATEIAALNLS